MTFLELAKTRYSVRSFKDQPIEDENLKLILEAGHVAPPLATISPKGSMLSKATRQEISWQLSAPAPSMRL